MYYPKSSKEPSGCLQAIFISRTLFGVFLVPIGLMFAAVGFVVALVAMVSVNPVLGLVPIGCGAAVFYGMVRWDKQRTDREIPRDEDDFA